jgi:hypothetical protein
MEVVLDAEGGLKERQSYTPWGERREGDGSTVSESGRRLGSKVRPGYTGHEMLDEVGIIHMSRARWGPGETDCRSGSRAVSAVLAPGGGASINIRAAL